MKEKKFSSIDPAPSAGSITEYVDLIGVYDDAPQSGRPAVLISSKMNRADKED